MTRDPKQLVNSVLECQKTILFALHSSEQSDWLHLDVTMGQLKGVFALAQQGPLGVGNLAERLGVTLPAASMLVEKLVKDGLVVRREDSADRRRTIVQLSAKGEQLVSQLLQGSRERYCVWLSQLDKGDLQALAQGLRALAAVAAETSP